ncbi:hypothetical protein Acsp03_24590 [Actinomadura sp. NBRC 104412]|uniref:hypothetical protein n=1 Tax=Actinomadura sp. NBRC 104412 TaxID=3032203 RepID=UPI0024A36E0A|nr:hypothetical protein [Actinomadura sp. NBRC 104412]GLZ04993.1 hypothetical protein Acsp03_24590 [Actinomadura sp. NBRC 104412]
MTRSPRHLKQQVKETVGEQVRDLPLHAVRLAMFGVGRALLLSDRLTKDYKEITEGGGVRPVIGRLRDDVQHTAEKVVGRVMERVRGEQPAPEPSRPRKTADAPAKPGAGGTGEISVGKPAPAPSARAVPDTKPETEPQARPEPKPEAKAKPEARKEPEARKAEGDAGKPDESLFEPKPEVKPAAPAEAEKLAAELPVPNYDEATLPQLRARLRGLSSDQVKLLREYERKHAARPDVLRMYENRIAKLNGLS